jgi:hypothetical protein
LPNKWGPLVVGASIIVALLVLLTWPYQLETIESTVSANGTGCAISTTSNGGWHEEVGASRVAYPLDMLVFVDNCAGAPQGRPHAAELVFVPTGKVIALGQSCARAEPSEDYPCRLELPPLPSLAGQDRYLVRVTRSEGGRETTAEMQLFLKREWRSAIFDIILSV